MDEVTKKALAENKRKKRGRLLKDCSDIDFWVAIDRIMDPEDSTPPADPNDTSGGWGYLKLAYGCQIDALKARLPARRVLLPMNLPRVAMRSSKVRAGLMKTQKGENARPIWAFPVKTLKAILAFLVDEPEKYLIALRGAIDDYEPVGVVSGGGKQC